MGSAPSQDAKAVVLDLMNFKDNGADGRVESAYWPHALPPAGLACRLPALAAIQRRGVRKTHQRAFYGCMHGYGIRF